METLTKNVTRDQIMETKAFKELTPMLQNITKNKRNIMAIQNGFNVASYRGYETWEKESQSCYANKMIVKELLENNQL